MVEIILQQPNMALFYDYEGSERIKAYWINRDLRFEVEPGEYDCPKCFNRGFMMGVENGSKRAVECECKAIRKNWDAIRRSGMEKLMQQHSFENYIAKDPWQKQMLETMLSFAEDPKGWAMLCGQSGSGKTHLASAACRILAAKHYRLQYVSWVEAAPVLKALSMEPEPRQSRMDTYKQAQVLFIDDLFKCGNMNRAAVRVTDADLRLAHELLEYRNIHKKITIVTTELTPDKLKELDGALFGRMVENCNGNILTVPYDERRNYRLLKGA